MAGWTTNATLNGDTIEPGGDFRTLVATKARGLGYTNYRVMLNGVEVEAETAPTEVPAGATIQVRPYDKAGIPN